MNRRHAITFAAASVSTLLSTSRSALARLQYLGTPVPDAKPKPDFSYAEHTPQESLYLGALFTWLELIEGTVDALGPAIAELETDMSSASAKTSILMPLGVWIHLAEDISKVPAPVAFNVVHGHAVDAFTHLASAADIISSALITENATAIALGSGDIYIANDSIGALIDELPFARPQRNKIIG